LAELMAVGAALKVGFGAQRDEGDGQDLTASWRSIC
jgi:hypothetical protein